MRTFPGLFPGSAGVLAGPGSAGVLAGSLQASCFGQAVLPLMVLFLALQKYYNAPIPVMEFPLLW